MLSMFVLIRKKFKIFKTIVVMNVIDVMDNFFWFKKTIKRFFHNQAMFSNISTMITKWMGRIKKINIAPIFVFSAFPVVVVFSRRRTKSFSFPSFAYFPLMFFRKFFAPMSQPNLPFGFFRTMFAFIPRGISLFKFGSWRGSPSFQCQTNFLSNLLRLFFAKKASFNKVTTTIPIYKHTLIIT